MHRLFVAIELPVAVRDRLLAAMGGVSGARWQRDDQLHLTLRFIGEIDRHIAQDIAAALGGVHAAPFELALRRVGMALEARAYAPHITLARFGRHSGPVGEFVTATVLGGPPFTVSGFALYESTLMRDGADYRTVERYSLQG
jgi:2'-5' RNA ligase